MNQDLQHDGGFEHPGNGRPEFGEERAQRMARFFLNPVRTELTKPVLCLCHCEACWPCVGGYDSIFVHDACVIVSHPYTDSRETNACLRGQFVRSRKKAGSCGPRLQPKRDNVRFDGDLCHRPWLARGFSGAATREPFRNFAQSRRIVRQACNMINCSCTLRGPD